MLKDMATTMKIEDQIRLEKEEADRNWNFVMEQVELGNLNANVIALAMKKCNEVDKILFKFECEE